MSYEVSKGLGNAASGASVGATIGSVVPGVGTAIGAGVGAVGGALTGFFGGDDGPSEREKALAENREMLGMLESRFQAAEQRDPTDTTLFEAGSSAATERAREQRQTDAGQAAARGLTGSQFEVAQAQQRQQQLGNQRRQLLVQGDQVQRQQERQALQSLLQQRASTNNLAAGVATAEQQQEQAQADRLSGAFSTLAQTGLGMAGGDTGGSNSVSPTSNGGFFDTGARFGIESY